MNGTISAAYFPSLLAWMVEWVAVPATMIWLWLRWVVSGPVLEDGGVRTLAERTTAREGTLAASALALAGFLLVYASQARSPAPTFPASPAEAIQTLKLGPAGCLMLLAGAATGALPRPVRHWARKGGWTWLRSYSLSVFLASGFALLSLVSYCFAGKDLHQLLLAIFTGMAAGYLTAPLLVKFLRWASLIT
jgi:hypothetical protein